MKNSEDQAAGVRFVFPCGKNQLEMGFIWAFTGSAAQFIIVFAWLTFLMHFICLAPVKVWIFDLNGILNKRVYLSV